VEYTTKGNFKTRRRRVKKSAKTKNNRRFYGKKDTMSSSFHDTKCG
jgi:hypothetical protein